MNLSGENVYSKSVNSELMHSKEKLDEDTTGNDSSEGLFPGDTGELPFDTRRALVQLLSGPVLDGHRHSKLWSALLRDEAAIRKYLCEIFLELTVEHDLQVAFTRQAYCEDADTPKLLRRAQLTFVQSALLLFLRQQLAQAETLGERVVVSRDDIIEQMRMYDSDDNTDKAGFDKRISAAIEKMKDYNILQKIKSSDDRFEISPTLKLLFSADEISELMKVYKSRHISTDDTEEQQNEEETENE